MSAPSQFDDPSKPAPRRLEPAAEAPPRYWRSLDERAGGAAYRQRVEAALAAAPQLDRREALKLMGASLALAGASGCSRPPPPDILPYVEMPETLIPGRPKFYATSIPVGGYAHGVVAESHEGRPTKLEGNPDHPATHGALDAWSQAAVLSLYDPDRSHTVLHQGTIATYGAFLSWLDGQRRRWDENQGAGFALLTDTVTSPSTAAAIRGLQERWPKMRWYAHEPAGQANVWAGCELAFGRRLEPRYDFTRAARVLTLDADFMTFLPGFLRYARDFMAQRRPRQGAAGMSRLYAVESTPTVTGSVADHRALVRADRIAGAAWQIARALGIEPPAGADTPAADDLPLEPSWADAVAADLRRHRGRALVLAGAGQPPAVHALASAMNEALAGFGKTVVLQKPVAATAGAPGLAALTAAIDAGAIDSLAILNANPVYAAPGHFDFARRLQQVPQRIHWGEYADETAVLCQWHVPATHALESWGDARAYDGTAGIVQPLIEPLGANLSALQFLYGLQHGVPAGALERLRAYWRERARTGSDLAGAGDLAGTGSDPAGAESDLAGPGFEHAWPRWLRRGVIPGTRAKPVKAKLSAGWQQRLAVPDAPSRDLVVQFAPDPAVYDGRYANNAWLQELPRPLTKLTWNNAALVSPALAARHGLTTGDVLLLAVNETAVELPAYVLPGQPDHAVTVHLGYGRHGAGAVGDGVGTSAYALLTAAPGWFSAGATLRATGGSRVLAITQEHHAMEGRGLIRAASLAHFRAHPEFAQHETEHKSIYPEPWPRGEPSPTQWGMAIDLTACIGCNACVTACQAENNIPVVGEQEVARGHEMHWIRIDRYFEGEDPGAPRMVFQPVPCMHCENAPCEYVCPVEATQHSADGLNQMVYNRCVGTRYCSQNCPYKVRRFNWFDYTGAGARYGAPEPVNNPDVTVRSRGVMEKCTYCVQRIQRAEIAAAAEGAPPARGGVDMPRDAVVTACQQACPTEAIAFGNISDPGSTVSQWKASPLNYAMLGHLNTRPRTTYLAAVRNTNAALKEAHKDGGGEGGQ